MLVQLENNATAWGSVPSKLFDLVPGLRSNFKNIKITFKAEFNSSNDKTHAFFKRPSKVEVKNVE
jgi:hypothetical protein